MSENTENAVNAAENTQGGTATDKRERFAWLRKSYKIICSICAVIGALVTFQVTVGAQAESQAFHTYRQVFRKHSQTISNGSILVQANTWPKYYQYSAPANSKFPWDLYAEDPGVTVASSTSSDEIAMELRSGGSGGTYAFYTDNVANLPDSNFFLSTQIKTVLGCNFGLVFRANMSGEYAWLYVSTLTSGQVSVQVDLVSTQYEGTIFQKIYRKQLDDIASIGVIQYRQEYIIEINDNEALGNISFSTINHHIGSGGLAGSKIGIGMCSCHRSAYYDFSNMKINTPA